MHRWWLLVLVSMGCGPKAKAPKDTSPTDSQSQTSSTVEDWSADSPHPSCVDDTGVILATPDEEPHRNYLQDGFDRYTAVEAVSGGAVYLYAQSEVSDLKLLRARSLLRFFVSDVPDSTWGTDKADVLESMVDNRAALIMPNGAHAPNNEYHLPAQPLYDDETPLAGSNWFMNNDWGHRDAAFEEIFHLVHDAGIGTYLPGARPEYQADLDAEARAAIEDGRWGIPVDPGVEQWLDELERENSLAQEYIASVIDSYYGLWGAWDESPGGMWGIYIAGDRDEISALDPRGQELLEQFLAPWLTYEVRLDPEFSGTFSLNFDPDEPYTHKTRYMTWVTATGSRDVHLIGNEEDNTLRGNHADNLIDGGLGTDTVVYCDHRDAYVLDEYQGDVAVSGPQGEDTLRDVERIHFADGVLTL